jgi:hypothetical protein
MRDSCHTEKIKSTCNICGSDLVTRPRKFRNGTIHLETRCTAGHFIEFTWQGRLLEVMPFGMHRGQPIKNLPPDYRKWLLDKAHIGKSLRRALEKVS